MHRYLWRGLAAVLLLGINGPCEVEAARIRAWGSLDEERYPVPEGDDFVAIAAGADRNLALREDGSLVQWGNTVFPDRWPMPEEKGFVAMAAAGLCIAVSSDGSLVGWGFTRSVPEGDDYVDVAVGNENIVLLHEDGRVHQEGHCWSHQCELPRADYIAIDANDLSTVALRRDGSVVSAPTVHEHPRDIPPGNSFVAVAAGTSHFLALREDGSLAAWGGANGHGELDVPDGNEFAAIAAGAGFSLALRDDGTLVAWGNNSRGQLDIPPGDRFVGISAYRSHALALEVPEPSVLVGLLSMCLAGGLVAWCRGHRRRRAV